MKTEEIKRISFSELKMWDECPYKHKLVYIDKLPHFEGNEFTAFGTAMHSACEHEIQNNKDEIYKVFLREFEKEIDLIPQEREKKEDLIEEMKEQAKPLCEQVIPEVKKYFKNFEVFSVEEMLMEEINEFESYDKKFKGFIDLVLKTSDGVYHIIDWKTCSWGWNTRRKTDKLTTYQLTYYKHFFAKKHNVDLNKIKTYFALLKRTATKENVEIFEVTSGQKKINNSLNLLRAAIININGGVSIKNRLSCKYCKFYKTENCP